MAVLARIRRIIPINRGGPPEAAGRTHGPALEGGTAVATGRGAGIWPGEFPTTTLSTSVKSLMIQGWVAERSKAPVSETGGGHLVRSLSVPKWIDL